MEKKDLEKDEKKFINKHVGKRPLNDQKNKKKKKNVQNFFTQNVLFLWKSGVFPMYLSTSKFKNSLQQTHRIKAVWWSKKKKKKMQKDAKRCKKVASNVCISQPQKKGKKSAHVGGYMEISQKWRKYPWYVWWRLVYIGFGLFSLFFLTFLSLFPLNFASQEQNSHEKGKAQEMSRQNGETSLFPRNNPVFRHFSKISTTRPLPQLSHKKAQSRRLEATVPKTPFFRKKLRNLAHSISPPSRRVFSLMYRSFFWKWRCCPQNVCPFCGGIWPYSHGGAPCIFVSVFLHFCIPSCPNRVLLYFLYISRHSCLPHSRHFCVKHLRMRAPSYGSKPPFFRKKLWNPAHSICVGPPVSFVGYIAPCGRLWVGNLCGIFGNFAELVLKPVWVRFVSNRDSFVPIVFLGDGYVGMLWPGCCDIFTISITCHYTDHWGKKSIIVLGWIVLIFHHNHGYACCDGYGKVVNTYS